MPRLFSCFRRGCSMRNFDSSGGLYDPAATADETTEEHRSWGRCAVLVELFSSQGCKKSPESEFLMSRLGRGDFTLDRPVIVLTFHVDYWDYLGWKDPFGSTQWTVRQKGYVQALRLDSMFTPQVVVQGRVQCVGNEEENVLSHIVSAQRFPSPLFEANFQRPTPDMLQVSLSGRLRMSIDKEGANVMVALYENGLVTDCTTGENQGRVLSNDYVVRGLENLCFVKDLSGKKVVSGTVNFRLWEGFNSSNCAIAVFVQNNSQQIFGSRRFDLPEDL